MAKMAPLPVRLVQFVDERQHCPGVGIKTQIGDKTHEIFFYPWLHGYRVTHKASGDEIFVPVHRVSYAKFDLPDPE